MLLIKETYYENKGILFKLFLFLSNNKNILRSVVATKIKMNVIIANSKHWDYRRLNIRTFNLESHIYLKML